MQTKDMTIFRESDALAHSLALQEAIKQEINQVGPITFARFMELALYAPQLGYYTGGALKIGKQGDFITAPVISPLYSHCIAKQCLQILSGTGGSILELGAGTGVMAADMLLYLEQNNVLPDFYYILEVSADLRTRQQVLIEQKIPHLQDKVVWLDTLTGFQLNGVIVANEVIDAFPVHLFKYQDAQCEEIFVTVTDNQLKLQSAEATPAVKEYLTKLAINFTDHYESECNLFITSWINTLSQVLKKGMILLLDYGFTRAEYYHPDRSCGTLMCHYRHHAHQDPLINIGLQDITAHVDFTAVAMAGVNANLTLAGFTNQANFLLACGIIDELQQLSEDQYSQVANKVKILTSPNEMGELFKVMAFTKEMHIPLIGFSMRDLSEKL